MSLLVYGESDIGFTRRRNEDAIAWRQSNNGRNVLAILADGIGGQQGEISRARQLLILA